MYTENDWWLYLAHHGIRGQKWGVQNGPPYPLSVGDHSQSEVDARWKRSLTKSKKFKAKNTNSTGIRYNGPREQGNNVLSDKRDRLIQEVEERTFPDGRVGYFPPATVIRDFERDLGKNPYEGPKGFDGLYDRVNPGFHGYNDPSTEPGTTNNCPFVGAAMQIASMGYDVVAGKSLGGASADAFERWFDGAELEQCHNFSEMKNDFLSFGDGASGVLQGYYGSGFGAGMGGHTLHWRNEKGKITVADGQNHTEWDFDDVAKQYGFGDNGCLYTRLDECKPNWDTLAEDGVIAVNNSGRRWKNKQTGGIYDKF